jgi:hypothetical protein
MPASAPTQAPPPFPPNEPTQPRSGEAVMNNNLLSLRRSTTHNIALSSQAKHTQSSKLQSIPESIPSHSYKKRRHEHDQQSLLQLNGNPSEKNAAAPNAKAGHDEQPPTPTSDSEQPYRGRHTEAQHTKSKWWSRNKLADKKVAFHRSSDLLTCCFCDREFPASTPEHFIQGHLRSHDSLVAHLRGRHGMIPYELTATMTQACEVDAR